VEKQWGQNPEFNFGLTYNLDKWGLPFAIDWRKHNYETFNCFYLNIDFLCFRFFLEIWKWEKNKCKKFD